MSIIVQKYGGTSVANPARIRAVAQRVIAYKQHHPNIVVVVSAMAGETNRLIALCDDMHAANVVQRDAVISTGEQITAGLLAMELARLGYPSRSLVGDQIGMTTDTAHGRARIVDIQTDRLHALLDSGETPVVAGFQGRSAEGAITTLGRGGSDTTAVALAAALAAQECQIFTDVDGIYTTDPRICPRARLLPQITFEEMLEMASLGSKVLQLRSVEFAGKYRVALRVLSSMSPLQDAGTPDSQPAGTLINYEPTAMEQPVVTGIAVNRSEAKLTLAAVPDTPGIAHRILAAMAEHHINIDMIVQNIGSAGHTDFSFTVHRDDYEQAMHHARQIADAVRASDVVGAADIGKLSVVGIGMKSHAGVASKMFGTLSERDINIQMISTSEIRISVVIAEAQLDEAVCALHDAFGLHTAAAEEVV